MRSPPPCTVSLPAPPGPPAAPGVPVGHPMQRSTRHQLPQSCHPAPPAQQGITGHSAASQGNQQHLSATNNIAVQPTATNSTSGQPTAWQGISAAPWRRVGGRKGVRPPTCRSHAQPPPPPHTPLSPHSSTHLLLLLLLQHTRVNVILPLGPVELTVCLPQFDHRLGLQKHTGRMHLGFMPCSLVCLLCCIKRAG